MVGHCVCFSDVYTFAQFFHCGAFIIVPLPQLYREAKMTDVPQESSYHCAHPFGMVGLRIMRKVISDNKHILNATFGLLKCQKVYTDQLDRGTGVYTD